MDEQKHKYQMTVHGQGYTVEKEFDTEIEAEAEAYLLLSKGIRFGNRIYPNTSVTYVEIVKKEIDG